MKFNILLVLGTLSAFGTVSCQGTVSAPIGEATLAATTNVARDVCWRAYWIVMAVQTPATTGTHATSGQPPPARLNSSTKSSSTQPPKSPPSIATPYHPLSSPPRGVRVAVRVKKQRGKDSEEGAGKSEVVEIDH
ncbi:unnamed protein product [Tilletia controversa]|uniref:Uncharacterized protein n=1 Tax=Tilletia controversa TaxID=13291 RepID=A0A8X7SWY6_9BASI|nr:hypothetical protein A4X06_0g4551 [Tilletia controversa]CAD6899999.1 unnamed protein product [Tilletia controversa]CAD6952547.1 unnamed protein product [Tilletia controversa]CAD6981430.1 unnamed protein product [Tilletia controversa]